METNDRTAARTVKAGRRMPRSLSDAERIADRWVNGLAIAAGVIGVLVLMATAMRQDSITVTLSLLVYSLGLLAMLICSALYNGGGASPRRQWFRRLDHAAIFVMIAGTYTPLLVVKIHGDWSRWLLLYVWAVAVLGAVLKLIWVDRFERLSVLLYLFLGWTILLAGKSLAASVSLTALLLLLAGGVLYSIGVVFHLWERLAYQQPIWHGFVIAAATCHYLAIFGEIAAPGLFA